jgi:hypothetical protein
MPHYSLFGGTLDSEISLTSLPATEAIGATWTLRQRTHPAALSSAALIGEQNVEGVHLRIYRHAAGFRLHYSDAGVFDVSSDGTRIDWSPGPDANDEYVRDCLLGYVFCTVLHAAGTFCLHGSAVEVNGRAIAFLAARFHGKSTLALALASAGARLLADDSVLVHLDSPVTVRNGEHVVRLFPDSRDAVLGSGARNVVPAPSGPAGRPPAGLLPNDKSLHSDLSSARLAFGSMPLDAVYQLWPVEPRPGAAVVRHRVPSATAVPVLVGQVKMGALLGRSELPIHVDRAARLAAAVPVYSLEVVRDFARLPDVVSEILDWHALPNDAAA